MKRIWSPWRSQFVQSKKKPSGCIFCNALKKKDDVENLIIARSELAFVILNRYPYTTGHVMIVPFQHKPSYEELDRATRNELMEMINRTTMVLRQIYQPEGFNVGANLGLPAGAGVAEHVHFHIVPRWIGDANFMSTIGEVRVLPEDLTETYRKVKEGWLKA
jgi:ATP adenylyltransferase